MNYTFIILEIEETELPLLSLQALILGGADTTSVSMIWTVAALVNNREALKRVQDELEVHVGRERFVEESDIKKLVYLQAVVKEAFRLYPPAHLLVPHEAIDDCCVAGYAVPRGTRVLVNVWKLQRDPGVWEDPLEFRPERFLTSHVGVDVRGQHLELIPFGAGRRACPGISFSLQVIHLTIARLVQGFNLDTPDNVPVDMSPELGITALKSCPLQVVLTPRLNEILYET